MSTRVPLCLLSEIPPGEGRTFEVAGRDVAVFHTRDGQAYATQATCPHRQGPLADGLTGGGRLVCPLHEWTFDLKSGEALQGDCGITVYPLTQAEDGTLVLELD